MKALLLIALGAATLLAQAPPDLKFEVASLRPSAPTGQERVDIGVHVDGAQVRINALPMRDYIARAYRVKLYQVSGPEWLTTERFDLNAKFPEGAKTDQIPEMLQSLLVERFQLKVHRDKKDLPVYAITVGKPPLRIQESAPEPDGAPAPQATNVAASGDARGVSVNLGNGAYYTFASGKLGIKKFTMEMVARQLERYVDLPILDQTGLTGRYDLNIQVTPEDTQTMMIHAASNAGMVLPPQVMQLLDNSSVTSLIDGFQQLGLKMDKRKAPLDLLVIDQLSKTPTEN